MSGDNTIRFDDGAGYERYMGVWSRRVGETFLQWLNPPSSLRWLDVGCGNGAFTALLIERCAPASVLGIDPSEQQLAYARTRLPPPSADFQLGDAMALPMGDDTVDSAVMPLVIFFVPEPARGMAEMARVVAPGGLISAYAWDMSGGGFPYYPLQQEMRAMDMPVPAPPSPEASDMDVLHELFAGAGLQQVRTRSITVERTFDNFDDYWRTVLHAPAVGTGLQSLDTAQRDELQSRMRAVLATDANGRIRCEARANAAVGRVPT